MPNFSELPLPLAVIVAAYWVINANNAEFAKKLIALVAEFTGKYEAIIKIVEEDRRASADRWLERDRLLNERLDRNTIAQEKLAHESHALRNIVTPLVINIQADRDRTSRNKPNTQRGVSGGNDDATG